MADKKQKKITALIVAAGRSERFGNGTPKQYAPIHGFPVLAHTIRAFLHCPLVTHIQVIISPDHLDLYNDAVALLPPLPPPVIGGGTRQESVRLGLMSLSSDDDDIVLIHDAARPCITPTHIEDVITALHSARGATLATPVSETLRRDNGGIIGETVSRDGLWSLQTPQGFYVADILRAHQALTNQSFTDDTALASAAGIDVAPVTGSRANIKITYAEDIMLAEKILSPLQSTPRTATGFDVHAFGDAANHIRIGGIDIPHTHKLAGHSDADVVLHAITDALYGLIADGDIGSHFPPSNNDFKGMDSAYFLADAVNAVQKAGGRITFIDTTIICEAPKIGPHREAIRARIADICRIDVRLVSVKATTTEQLGFTGRREGIAAQAVVTGLF